MRIVTNRTGQHKFLQIQIPSHPMVSKPVGPYKCITISEDEFLYVKSWDGFDVTDAITSEVAPTTIEIFEKLVNSGVINITGSQGSTGLIGPTGIQGIQGHTGVQGQTGVQGAQGTTGEKGDRGNVGFTGVTGDIGATGVRGVTGIQGNTGIQGETGVRGHTGIQGIQGNTGVGIQGDTGIQGIQGNTGPFGQTGVQGIQGDTGVRGHTGIQGIQGNTGIQGETGVAGATGVRGPTGAQGIQGDTGIQGIQGQTGPFGQTGVRGPTGAQGIQGDTGIQGIQGNTGVQGDTGVQGPTGIIGPTGHQGHTGVQGSIGIQGQTGVQGTQGQTGVRGHTGVQGIQGDRGFTGVQGHTGIQGATGVLSTEQQHNIDALLGIHTDTSEPNGFADRTSSVMTFDDSTRTFTITPVSGSYTVYVAGKKLTISTPLTYVLDNVSQPNFVYIDEDGELGVFNSPNPAIYTSVAYAAFILWSAEENRAIVFGEERHGFVLDGDTHAYLHSVFGAQLLSGGSVTGPTTGNGNSNADAYLNVSNTSIRDEDIVINIVDASSPSANFEQALSSPARLPIFYRSGTNGNWRKLDATNFPVSLGSSLARYNHYDGSSWSLADASDGGFVVSYIFATNDLNEPIIAVMGQGNHPTLKDATDNGVWSNVSYGNLPFQEMKLLARVILETSSAFTNDVKSAIRDIFDLRYDISREYKQPPVADHGSLNNLHGDHHPQYLPINGVRGMQGTLDMGSNPITNASNINGVSITAHASRHLPSGADPLTTGTPSTIGTANSAGTANAFSRADHVHAHGNQTGGTLHAVATTGAAGFMSPEDKAKLDSITTQRYMIYADQVELPVNTGWAVNNIAPISADTVTPSIAVVRFDDTTEEGIGFSVSVPAGVTTMTLHIQHRNQTAGTGGIVPALYFRQFPNNGTASAWSSRQLLTTITATNDTNWKYYSHTINLSALSIVADGRDVQFELTRFGSSGSDTKSGDWVVRRIMVEFV